MVNRVSPDEDTMALWLGKVVSLTLQGELKEMVSLGKHVQWEIGLPDSDLITLV
jgi:hypothetical protein